MKPRQWLVPGVSVLLVACASLDQSGSTSNSTNTGTERQIALVQSIDALASRSDPASLATAALMAGIEIPGVEQVSAGRAAELATRAASEAPGQALYAWLRLQICEAKSECDRSVALSTLQQLDPDNAAVWFDDWIAARRRGDSTSADEAFRRMSTSSHFDVYWVPLVVAVNDTLKSAGARLSPQWRPANELDRFAQAVALSGTVLSLPLRELTTICDGLSLGAPNYQSCTDIAHAMQRADTMAVQAVGFGIEQRLALDTDARDALATQKRLFDWRHTATVGDIAATPEALERDTRQRIALMRRSPREEDVNIGLLVARHLPSSPPPGWVAPES